MLDILKPSAASLSSVAGRAYHRKGFKHSQHFEDFGVSLPQLFPRSQIVLQAAPVFSFVLLPLSQVYHPFLLLECSTHSSSDCSQLLLTLGSQVVAIPCSILLSFRGSDPVSHCIHSLIVYFPQIGRLLCFVFLMLGKVLSTQQKQK